MLIESVECFQETEECKFPLEVGKLVVFHMSDLHGEGIWSEAGMVKFIKNLIDMLRDLSVVLCAVGAMEDVHSRHMPHRIRRIKEGSRTDEELMHSDKSCHLGFSSD